MGRGVTGERVPGERDSGWNPVYSRLTGGRGVGNARETRLKTLGNGRYAMVAENAPGGLCGPLRTHSDLTAQRLFQVPLQDRQDLVPVLVIDAEERSGRDAPFLVTELVGGAILAISAELQAVAQGTGLHQDPFARQLADSPGLGTTASLGE